MSNPLRQDSICKPYIFQRADLVNTEIIITNSPNPLIKSAKSVVTYGRQFIHCCSLHRSSNTEGHTTYIVELHFNFDRGDCLDDVIKRLMLKDAGVA